MSHQPSSTSTSTGPTNKSSTTTPRSAAKLPFKPRGSVFNPRTITAPIAALIMAGLLYTYSVSSIRAAKKNAQLHREADGGQLDMRKESLRRHGILERVEGTGGVELFRGGGRRAGKARQETRYLNEGKAVPLGSVMEEEEGRPRTEVEGGLEGYKGRGNLVRRMEEERERKGG